MVTIDELLAQISQLQEQLVALQSEASKIYGLEFSFNNNFFVSREELEKASPEKREGYRKIFKNGITEMRYEINRMENLLENFSRRSASLMTLAGLISLLPFAFSNNAFIFLKHYLFWIFPFLSLAMIAYVFSFSRKYTYRTAISAAPDDTLEELIILRDEANAAQNIWMESHRNFERSFKWHKINNIVLQLFLINYVFNFYLFVFFILPGVTNMIMMTSLLSLIGVFLYIKKMQISNNQKIGDNYKMATGTPPPDIDTKQKLTEK